MLKTVNRFLFVISAWFYFSTQLFFKVMYVGETGLGFDTSSLPRVSNYTVIFPGPFNDLHWKMIMSAEGHY